MGIIAWIIFGALAGWVASLIAGTNERQGCLMNIVIGVAGAFVAGLLANLLFGVDVVFDFDIRSFLIAVLGALLLLLIFRRR